MRENAFLINDMRKWLLSRKIIDRTGNDYGTFEYISSFRIYIKHELFSNRYVEKRV